MDATTFLLATAGDVRLVAYGTLAEYVGSISLEKHKGWGSQRRYSNASSTFKVCVASGHSCCVEEHRCSVSVCVLAEALHANSPAPLPSSYDNRLQGSENRRKIITAS